MIISAYTPIQRAACQQPRAGVPTGASPRMAYVPIAHTPARAQAQAHARGEARPGIKTFPAAGRSDIFGSSPVCRDAPASIRAISPQDKLDALALRRAVLPPARITMLLNASQPSSSCMRQGGRIRYGEQDRRRDLTVLTCAKDDLDKYVELNRKSMSRVGLKAHLKEMVRIGAKIEALKDLILHTDPCSPETHKFQRETNMLKSLVTGQTMTSLAKSPPSAAPARQRPSKAAQSNPSALPPAAKPGPAAEMKAPPKPARQVTNNPIYAGDTGSSSDSGSSGSSDSSLESGSDSAAGHSPPTMPKLKSALRLTPRKSALEKNVSWSDEEFVENMQRHGNANPKHDISIPKEWRGDEIQPSPNWHLKEKGSPMRRLWRNRIASFRSLPIPDPETAVRAAAANMPRDMTSQTGETQEV